MQLNLALELFAHVKNRVIQSCTKKILRIVITAPPLYYTQACFSIKHFVSS